ncbi:hypothetical protein FCH83_07870 [Pseudomonas putida]|nr:hypothetical protein [Pseudomonas putida]NTZ03183.1 hypothetical protein [Pseudomonas putida]NTZ23368.1 hypothetical protein [Pseudomonas putida]NTZ56935.1 hypothetical protein [Pseudomonas putida]NTZ66336.1 hypothetical protein [Pseudomonas putida]
MFSCAGLFAGSPAPTGLPAAPGNCAVPVGAGKPAKGPAQEDRHKKTPAHGRGFRETGSSISVRKSSARPQRSGCPHPSSRSGR